MSHSPSAFHWDGTTVKKERKMGRSSVQIVDVANVPSKVEHVVVTDSVTKIPAYAFRYHNQLRSIHIALGAEYGR